MFKENDKVIFAGQKAIIINVNPNNTYDIQLVDEKVWPWYSCIRAEELTRGEE